MSIAGAIGWVGLPGSCACSQAVLTVCSCLQWPEWPGHQVMLEQDRQLMAEAGSESGNDITLA